MNKSYSYGKLLQTQNVSNTRTTTLDAQQLPNGIYLLALYADGVQLTQSKIVVQH